MEFQMQVISGRHEQWYEFVDWSKLRIQDLGTPQRHPLRRMGQVAGPSPPLSVNTPLAGSTRFPNSDHLKRMGTCRGRRSEMTEPFIFIGAYTIKEGKLEGFKRYWPEFVDFVEESEPRLIAFNAYVSDDGTEVGIVQVHPDVDSMEFHMKLIREHVEHAFAEFLDRDMGAQIYGAISDSALEIMRQLAGPVPLTVKPHGVGGFTRSAAERAHVVS
jgi:hypothetical protein